MKKLALIIIFMATLFGSSSMYAQGSLVQQGKTQLKNKQYTSAFSTFKKAASGGNAEAMYYVGECYEKGRGTELFAISQRRSMADMRMPIAHSPNISAQVSGGLNMELHLH